MQEIDLKIKDSIMYEYICILYYIWIIVIRTWIQIIYVNLKPLETF